MARTEDNNVIVQIKDTGTGMSKAVLDKLFTPQIKALSNIREKNKGAGIGLMLVKGFLDAQGGKIWVESTEGEGSSFYFTLPVNEHIDVDSISET
jgi:two-component system CheB/CheR fusion protein